MPGLTFAARHGAATDAATRLRASNETFRTAVNLSLSGREAILWTEEPVGVAVRAGAVNSFTLLPCVESGVRHGAASCSPPFGGASPLTARTRRRDNVCVREPRVRRVVVVEDHPIFREGVVQCLDGEPDFTVVGQWASGDVDLDTLRALAPDLVLMDVELPVASGIEVTRRIRSTLPTVRLVLLAAFAA